MPRSEKTTEARGTKAGREPALTLKVLRFLFSHGWGLGFRVLPRSVELTLTF